MRSVVQFISAIITAAIGGLLVILFQGPISQFVSPDRLIMEVHAGPWSPLPPSRGETADAGERQGMPPYAVRQVLAGETVYVARIDLHNPGRRTIDQIRLTFGPHGPFAAMILDARGPTRIVEPKELTLRALAPGERLIVYVWTIFDLDSSYGFHDWQAYSSEGPAAFRVFSANREQFDDPIFNFVDNQLSGFVTFLAFGGMILFGLVFAYIDTYLRQLFSDEAHFVAERQRYASDPKKFSPNLRP